MHAPIVLTALSIRGLELIRLRFIWEKESNEIKYIVIMIVIIRRAFNVFIIFINEIRTKANTTTFKIETLKTMIIIICAQEKKMFKNKNRHMPW